MPRPPVDPALLEIRLWREDDAPALGRAIAESVEHLRPWMAWAAEEPITDAERRARIWAWERSAATGGDETFGVLLGDDVVGGTGLHHRVGRGGLEIGYWVHVAHTGRGIATAVAGELVRRAFARPSVTHVEIHHDIANVASGRGPARRGFARGGEHRRPPVAPAETGTERVWRRERP